MTREAAFLKHRFHLIPCDFRGRCFLTWSRALKDQEWNEEQGAEEMTYIHDGGLGDFGFAILGFGFPI
jgi:hypothetical protein